MDGGFTGIADVSKAMVTAGALDDYRLIGGTAVMLHIQRLGLDLPLRATGDADIGVSPHVLRNARLVDAIEALGYVKVEGNRWERPMAERRVAAVDLLVPAYTSRARHTLKIGSVVTTEVPGLADAMRRPGVSVTADLRLTTGEVLQTTVVLPDAVGTLVMKAQVRTVRNEARDADDLWRCLEIAAAEGVTRDTFGETESLRELRPILRRELGNGGPALVEITTGLQADAAARMRTRIRALLAEVVGVVE